MTKKIWDLYAPIYERAMQMDKKIYSFMYCKRDASEADEGSCITAHSFD